jgi:hypothetical protein
MRYFLIFIILALVACKPISTKHFAVPSAMPHLMLWVWEHPTSLSYINTHQIGVATLIATCDLQENINCYLRHQPLLIPPNTYQLAVIRLQTISLDTSYLNSAYAALLAQKILEIYKTHSYRGLQIDFDATPSLRAFYQQLLLDLRKGLSKHESLSITALASWCTTDRWMENANLPIDYAVPMLYDLDPRISMRLRFQNYYLYRFTQLSPICRKAIGLATYEPWQPVLKTSAPVFVFTKGSWQSGEVSKAIVTAQFY